MNGDAASPAEYFVTEPRWDGLEEVLQEENDRLPDAIAATYRAL